MALKVIKGSVIKSSTNTYDTGYTIPTGKVFIVSYADITYKHNGIIGIDNGGTSLLDKKSGIGSYDINNVNSQESYRSFFKGMIFTSGMRLAIQSESTDIGRQVCWYICGEELTA